MLVLLMNLSMILPLTSMVKYELTTYAQYRANRRKEEKEFLSAMKIVHEQSRLMNQQMVELREARKNRIRAVKDTTGWTGINES